MKIETEMKIIKAQILWEKTSKKYAKKVLENQSTIPYSEMENRELKILNSE